MSEEHHQVRARRALFSRLNDVVLGPPTYAHPLRAGRHPFQVYMMFLCLVTSLPAIIVGEVGSGAIQEALPAPLVFGWYVMLIVGSASALLGAFWTGHRVEDGLTIERIGLGFVGVTAIIFSVLVLANTGLLGTISAAIIGGFGAACLRRTRDLGGIIRNATEYAKMHNKGT